MSSSPHFTPALFEFLAELSMNNEREWFQANKARYERDVREPMIEFVVDFGEKLREISPHMVADPRKSGGSVFRIYQDVRFSRDKSPYKTNAGAHFRHEVGREVHGPGFYLHLQPGSVFGGAGIWMPNSATLGKIRGAIVANPEKWVRIVTDESFDSMYTLEGDSLKRAPRGFDPDHPLIDHLKRKSFVAGTGFSEDRCVLSGFHRPVRGCVQDGRAVLRVPDDRAWAGLVRTSCGRDGARRVCDGRAAVAVGLPPPLPE